MKCIFTYIYISEKNPHQYKASLSITLSVLSRIKILGLAIQHKGWWNKVNSMTTSGSQKLFLLKCLKHVSQAQGDLLAIHFRPMLESAAPAWHPELTHVLASQLELVQKIACCISLGVA